MGQMELILAAKALHENRVQERVLSTTRPGDEIQLKIVQDFEELRAQSQNRMRLACFYEQKPWDVMVVLGEKELSGPLVCPT